MRKITAGRNDADQRIERHEKVFPLDLQRAYDLGVKQFKA